MEAAVGVQEFHSLRIPQHDGRLHPGSVRSPGPLRAGERPPRWTADAMSGTRQGMNQRMQVVE